MPPSFQSPRSQQASSAIPGRDRLVCVFAAALAVFTAWAFGGRIAWAEWTIAIAGAGGSAALLAAHWMKPGAFPRRRLWLLAPFAGYLALALAGTLNPAFVQTEIAGRMFFRWEAPSPWFPASAPPERAMAVAALHAGVFLPAFLLMIVSSRRALLVLAGALAGNAFLLALFGAFQQFTGAEGLYFGQVSSPNPKFFSTFIYQNHWGAFALLWIAAAIGLALRFRARSGRFWNTPGPALLLAATVLCITIPLTTSRSCTALLLPLIGFAAFRHWRVRRRSGPGAGNERTRAATIVAGVFLLASILAMIAFGQEGFRDIHRKMTDEIERYETEGTFGERVAVMRDTARMFADRPAFGWGLGSFPVTFQWFRGPDIHAAYYEDAHSDWLQQLAEVGLAGSILFWAAPALLLVRHLRERRFFPDSDLLLCGCLAIAVLAMVEFPFVNPAVHLSFWILFFTAIRLGELRDPKTFQRPGSG